MDANITVDATWLLGIVAACLVATFAAWATQLIASWKEVNSARTTVAEMTAEARSLVGRVQALERKVELLQEQLVYAEIKQGPQESPGKDFIGPPKAD